MRLLSSDLPFPLKPTAWRLNLENCPSFSQHSLVLRGGASSQPTDAARDLVICCHARKEGAERDCRTGGGPPKRGPAVPHPAPAQRHMAEHDSSPCSARAHPEPFHSHSEPTALQGEGDTRLFTVQELQWGNWPPLSADGCWGQVSFGLPPLLKPTLHIYTKSLEVWAHMTQMGF